MIMMLMINDDDDDDDDHLLLDASSSISCNIVLLQESVAQDAQEQGDLALDCLAEFNLPRNHQLSESRETKASFLRCVKHVAGRLPSVDWPWSTCTVTNHASRMDR